MPKVHVHRSKIINAPIDDIRTFLNDFHNWTQWSPWLITDPKATVDVKPDGKYYSWAGPRVGEGQMSITSENTSEIKYDLEFLKPWKSKAKTYFTLEAIETNKTKLSWDMDTSMPFFLFFMKNMMKGMIGMDYDRGLNMIKDLSETGAVPSTLSYPEVETFSGVNYVAFRRKVKIVDMPKVMAADFGTIYGVREQVEHTGFSFAQYHKFDFGSGMVDYTAGIGCTNPDTSLAPDLVSGSLPAAKLKIVRHTGPYRHIGNAWSAAQFMVRSKEFKPQKKYHPFEIYRNDPQQTAPNDLVTDICFAMR